MKNGDNSEFTSPGLPRWGHDVLRIKAASWLPVGDPIVAIDTGTTGISQFLVLFLCHLLLGIHGVDVVAVPAFTRPLHGMALTLTVTIPATRMATIYKQAT